MLKKWARDGALPICETYISLKLFNEFILKHLLSQAPADQGTFLFGSLLYF